jgi:hypothetical protein
MGSKRKVTIAWILFVITLLIILIRVAIWVIQLATSSSLPVVDQDVGTASMAGAFFLILGMLIITRLPDNRVGWLMMIIAVGAANPSTVIIASLPAPPTSLSPGLWLILWLNNWVWIPVIFPLILIPLHFPTGRPPSRRWDWVNWLAIGMGLFFMLFAAFQTPIGPLDNKAWMLPNPIGFIPEDWGASTVWTIWPLGLATIALASVVSLVVRYRRAQEIERQQIKWLLYAAALFAVSYSVTGMNSDSSSSLIGILNFIGTLTILAIPIAIAIAILRYRLYDIDILIRRTLQYSLLTGWLALVYFGGVVLLQSIFHALTGEDSQFAIVISTLGIAALFSPLRLRVQAFIDQRFYRKKYDAEHSLAWFAAAARDEVDQEKLTAALLGTVDQAVQPENVSLWLTTSNRSSR